MQNGLDRGLITNPSHCFRLWPFPIGGIGETMGF